MHTGIYLPKCVRRIYIFKIVSSIFDYLPRYLQFYKSKHHVKRIEVKDETDGMAQW